MDISIKKELKNDNMIITPSTNRRLYMKEWQKNLAILTTGVITFAYVITGCGKPTDQAQKDCENYFHKDTTAEWKNGKCVKTYVGDPVVQKKDTIVKFNAGGDGSLPPYSDLDSISHLSHIADVFLEFAKENQKESSVAVFYNLADTLKAYSERNPKIKIVKGKVYVSFDPANFPQFDLVSKFEKLGITLIYDNTKSAKSVVGTVPSARICNSAVEGSGKRFKSEKTDERNKRPNMLYN